MLAKQSKVVRRDDFSQATVRKLAARSGGLCSNPDCRASTSGPQLDPGGTVNVGVASHISAASPGGPRYSALLTAEKRTHIDNGIWLCQTCAKLIDNDETRYTGTLLVKWKAIAEQEAHRRIGKAKPTKQAANAERELKRNLRIRDRMQKDFFRPWNEVCAERSRQGRSESGKSYERFRYRAVIVHRLGDDSYPEVDDAPGISSWFKAEIFDFYHDGIKVILSMQNGVIERGHPPLINKFWSIIPYKSDFDETKFRSTSIWEVGCIPFRNIRHYDMNGDEYYNMPHLYCDFSIQAMPYERFEYALVGGDNDHDWPLRSDLKLPPELVTVPQGT